MDRYKKIMSLVEEVRDLLGPRRTRLDEAKKKKLKLGKFTDVKDLAQSMGDADKLAGKKVTSAASKKLSHFIKDYSDDEKAAHAAHVSGGIDKKTMRGLGKAHGKGTKHNPFKYLKKNKRLGPGPRHDQNHPGAPAGKWKCRCSTYKCHCKGIGENSGKKKNVFINKAYKQRYNVLYRKWRKIHAKKYEGGRWGKRPGRKEAKPETGKPEE